MVGDAYGVNTTPQFSGVLLAACMVAAALSLMAVVIFNCGPSHERSRPRNDVMCYGSAGVRSYAGGHGGGGTGGSGFSSGGGGGGGGC
ncbi:hypothetical protein MUK42_29988 [Musa troglodytarum]|uniref:Uncharacterized protein n=1 Tax=Musa troglodytarum TaxID=320322 RepID=A0A9E7K0A6_9LILI|nr:hypothetical protein MUK42_29988 [Musa troglodytarum]